MRLTCCTEPFSLHDAMYLVQCNFGPYKDVEQCDSKGFCPFAPCSFIMTLIKTLSELCVVQDMVYPYYCARCIAVWWVLFDTELWFMVHGLRFVPLFMARLELLNLELISWTVELWSVHKLLWFVFLLYSTQPQAIRWFLASQLYWFLFPSKFAMFTGTTVTAIYWDWGVYTNYQIWPCLASVIILINQASCSRVLFLTLLFSRYFHLKIRIKKLDKMVQYN